MNERYEEYRALLYLFDTFKYDGYVWAYPLKDVMFEINHAPVEVKPFLKRRCPTVKHLEEYLNSWNDDFWVENGRMTLHYPWVKDGSDNVLPYFIDILDTYKVPPNYKNFYGHIGQADPDVQDFIQMFYPNDFKQFLLNHPNVFVVFNNDTVSLTENEAVKYFQQRVREGREGWYYMNLRGCIGQAEKYIINFINECYPEEEFLQFLENNSYAFEVDEDGKVYLN